MNQLTAPNQSFDELAPRRDSLTRDGARAVFGQVMGLVALTVGCAALGAYLGRDLTGGAGIAFFIGTFACIIGLNIASSRGHEQLATGLLFGLGLLLEALCGRDQRKLALLDVACGNGRTLREILRAAHAVRGGEQHQAHGRQPGVADDSLAEFKAIAFRHHVIEYREIEGRWSQAVL